MWTNLSSFAKIVFYILLLSNFFFILKFFREEKKQTFICFYYHQLLWLIIKDLELFTHTPNKKKHLIFFPFCCFISNAYSEKQCSLQGKKKIKYNWRTKCNSWRLFCSSWYFFFLGQAGSSEKDVLPICSYERMLAILQMRNKQIKWQCLSLL